MPGGWCHGGTQGEGWLHWWDHFEVFGREWMAHGRARRVRRFCCILEAWRGRKMLCEVSRPYSGDLQVRNVAKASRPMFYNVFFKQMDVWSRSTPAVSSQVSACIQTVSPQFSQRQEGWSKMTAATRHRTASNWCQRTRKKLRISCVFFFISKLN